MKKINLPCLRGVTGDWTYFSTVMKIKDIVQDKRIITVSESEELYTSNINNILQREIDEKRITQISDYILLNGERFFSSIIVAIHNGNPVWSDFDIESHFRIENELINDEDLMFIENKLGILTLSGTEEIFALDGQHRLMGLRAAYHSNNAVGDEEIPLLIVIHNNSLKQRTRRLFTVLNKYAQKPKEAELIIIDEDDTAAIITRRLLETHPILSLDNAISDSNTASLSTNDLSNFSTMVIINRINKTVLNRFKIDYSIRPQDRELELYYDHVLSFWQYFFNSFPDLLRFIHGLESRFDNGDLVNRNKETGGSLLLHPVGQILFAQVYSLFEERDELYKLSEYIPLIDFNLNGTIWKYIFWKDKMLPKNDALKRNIFLYLVGKYSESKIQNEISKVYENFGIKYDNHIQPIQL